ncbi:MAG: hypothetical protein AAGF11_56535, partial [Myxococcota bacterium]
MVLPQSPADAGGAQAWASASLGPIARLFERSEQGVLVLLHGAVPTRLGEVVRLFSPQPPWSTDGKVLRVCLEAAELADVPEGSRVLLRVRTQDIAHLNVIRPLFAERRLRAILWADEEALGPLLSRAVDLVDWVGRSVQVPPRRWPAFAEQGVRAALDVGVPFAWDGERQELEAMLEDVGWTKGVVELRAQMNFWEMLRKLEESPGLPVALGMRRDTDWGRVWMALAHAWRKGAWVALAPAANVGGLWPLHARQAGWEDATTRLRDAGWEHAALMAAWVDLEPERIELAVARGQAAPDLPEMWEAERVVTADAPLYVLRARIKDADVRTQSTEQTLRTNSAERWPGELDEDIEDHMVRSSEVLRDRVPDDAAVDAASSIGLFDVAAELGRIRFERGADDRADRVVDWLEQYGEVELAASIASSWVDRARTSGDEESLGSGWTRLGDLERALGNGEQARLYFKHGLAVRKALVEREPGRSDLQRDLSVSLNKLGDLER